jgi:hypothetical protein
VEVDDRTPIQKLSVSDQLRVLLKRFTYDEANELKTEDAVTISQLQLRADLFDFIKKAVAPIVEAKHSSVQMEISNQFDPVLMDVLESKQIKNYYNVKVYRPKIEYDIPYSIIVILEVKRN